MSTTSQNCRQQAAERLIREDTSHKINKYAYGYSEFLSFDAGRRYR